MGKKELRIEWIMIGGFRVEPTLLKKFREALVASNYANMAEYFRDCMRKTAEGVTTEGYKKMQEDIKKMKELLNIHE